MTFLPHPEHNLIRGGELSLPLVYHCGYNDWHSAARLPWHEHDGFEFVFLLEGAVTFELPDGSGFLMRGGQYSLNLPHLRHRARYDVNTPCKMCWIVFRPNHRNATRNSPFVREELRQIARRCTRAGNCYKQCSPALTRTAERFRDAVIAFFVEPSENLHSSRLRAILAQLLIEAVMQLSSPSASRKDEYIPAAIEYMKKRRFEPIRINDIAAYLGFSRSRLYEMFRSETGLTPNDYLLRLRLDAACDRLRSSEDSITRIALSCGFNSSQNFCQVFRKYLRQSPSDFRAGGVSGVSSLLRTDVV